jgi:hypothetical protein
MELSKKQHFTKFNRLKRKANRTLKDEQDLHAYRHLAGAGWFDGLFQVRHAFSDADTLTFNQVKDSIIEKLEVVRTPLKWTSQLFASIASFGTFDTQAKELGYDRVFHLYFLIHLQGYSTPILYEKSETITFRFEQPSFSIYTQSMDVSIPQDLTVGEFVTTAQSKISPDDYWFYSFDKQNCQQFVLQNLQANGLLTPQIQTFVFQDASRLLSKAPDASRKFAQHVSTISAIYKKFTGKGLIENAY